MRQEIAVGNDSFLEIRQNNCYYVDKSLLIKDFILQQDKVTLLTRPRRFGKTLNMTMLREFFDITKDSREIFRGLAILDTKHAGQINSRPVVYLTFKDCKGDRADSLKSDLIHALFREYRRYNTIFKDQVDKRDLYYVKYYAMLEALTSETATWETMRYAVSHLLTAAATFYGISPILLIDEYDQPILSSYENGFRLELNDFFSVFYGSALKGNEYLYSAVLTGIQRVAKESIFSGLNNVKVYTVFDERYSSYFGLNEEETEKLLNDYGLKLDDNVKKYYDGYLFGSTHMYNPWSIVNYASDKLLSAYWVHTSSNYLIKELLSNADPSFQQQFQYLLQEGVIEVDVALETSFMESKNNYTLWGFLVNAGYITAAENTPGSLSKKVRIPNNEVKSEFQCMIAEQADIEPFDLNRMFAYLEKQDIEGFMRVYEKIVIDCTSFHDAKENAYHMLFLGMCISLRNIYKVTSNLESGYGRYDICLEALNPEHLHIVVEFKQGKEIEKLKEEALNQIIEQKYYSGLKGRVLCIGLAHDGKRCAVMHKTIKRM